MNRKVLQAIALGYCTAVLVGAGWFWNRQIDSVLELLRIAYG